MAPATLVEKLDLIPGLVSVRMTTSTLPTSSTFADMLQLAQLFIRLLQALSEAIGVLIPTNITSRMVCSERHVEARTHRCLVTDE